ncbi:MAG: hypothetical protein ACXWCM_11775 [Acidimicrobiales bacterium]
MADAHLGTTQDAPTDAPGTAPGAEPTVEGAAPTPAAPAQPAEVPEATAPAEAAPVTLTWAEQEVVDALKRLARAQSAVADLEARAAEATSPTFEAADVERLEQLQGPLAQARAKAAGRFGKAAARERLDELEMAERLVLDRMGVGSFDEYRAAIEAPQVETVDAQVLAFAERELASARAAWLEVQALEVPPAEAPAPEVEPEVTIDLTTGPHAGDDVA